jgi:hypothetical protein
VLGDRGDAPDAHAERGGPLHELAAVDVPGRERAMEISQGCSGRLVTVHGRLLHHNGTPRAGARLFRNGGQIPENLVHCTVRMLPSAQPMPASIYSVKRFTSWALRSSTSGKRDGT